jgi:heat-inducible transcriptional repressor
VRNTLAELSEMGLIDKPHASAGRIPTEEGMRIFVDRLLHLEGMEDERRASLDRSFDAVTADAATQLASQVLSDETRQLGFVVAPRLDQLLLRHVSFVRLSADRILAVLVDSTGHAHQRAIDCTQRIAGSDRRWGGDIDQAALDRMAGVLNERVSGRTLQQTRDLLRREIRSMRNRASKTLEQALRLGLQAAEAAIESPTEGDLVIATRLALLEQPEFSDPDRLRELFGALEQSERLVDLVGELLDGDGVAVVLGDDLHFEGLAGCALVAARYGRSQGALGVIGPTRMDYERIIPLVGYCSRLVTDKLNS